MKWWKIADDWHSYVNQAKAAWPKLSWLELSAVAGRRDLLQRNLANSYGLSSEQADDAIMAWQYCLVPNERARR